MSRNTRAASSTKINNPIEQKLCFEIPIYRCNEDKHSAEMAKEKARYVSPLSRLQSYATAERRFDEEEWYPWRYNEAIGWIQLSICGTEVKGELYFVKAKKIQRRMRKRFCWHHEVFEIDVSPNQSSADIYKSICVELDKFRREKPYRKWHLDTEGFQNIGPFIDWRKFVDFCGGDSERAPKTMKGLLELMQERAERLQEEESGGG